MKSNITAEGIEITKRFFEAIDYLKTTKQIHGMSTITEEHGINYGNLHSIYKFKETRRIKPEYLHILCKYYNISPEFLLLGTGNIQTK